MIWSIEDDGKSLNPASYDGSVWQWRLRHADDPQRGHVLILRITGTAMAMGKEALPFRAEIARDSQGRSEVEVILDWPEPPDEIEIHSQGVRRSGGDPGPEQREINEIVEWFDERGAVVFLFARGGGSGSTDTIQMTRHTAYVAARGADEHLFKAEGTSHLEAIRKAKEKWESDGHGVYLELHPSRGTSSTSLGLTTPKVGRVEKAREAAKASGREFFIVAWQPLPSSEGDTKAPHLIEVTNQDGEFIDGGIGDDPENSILEVAPFLLPSWSKPPEQS
jgi:hypothetical protein